MKRIYFILVSLALFLSSISASAQIFSNGFSTMDLTYSPMNSKVVLLGESDKEYMSALSFNWMHASELPVDLPLYLQYGVGLQYAWKTETETHDDFMEMKIKSTTNFLTAKIPVNIMYGLDILNPALTVLPYAGINLRGHLVGNMKMKTTIDGEKESDKMNFFSKDDMDELRFNRICLGWQVGAKVIYERYVFGIGYEGPITHLYNKDDFKVTNNQFNISVGVRF